MFGPPDGYDPGIPLGIACHRRTRAEEVLLPSPALEHGNGTSEGVTTAHVRKRAVARHVRSLHLGSLRPR
jgi:hypothetical protein